MKDKQSVALQYNSDLPAPFVVARGRGHLAEKLIELANVSNVPLVDDSALAERLFYVEVGQFIPEPFYKAVAEVLALVFAAQREAGIQKREEGRP